MEFIHCSCDKYRIAGNVCTEYRIYIMETGVHVFASVGIRLLKPSVSHAWNTVFVLSQYIWEFCVIYLM